MTEITQTFKNALSKSSQEDLKVLYKEFREVQRILRIVKDYDLDEVDKMVAEVKQHVH